MSTDDQDDALFKALGHRARRHMLDLLKKGPLTTGHLCEALPQIDRCTVMQHLKVLEKAGLVVVERRGRERWNHLDALPIQAWVLSRRALNRVGKLRCPQKLKATTPHIPEDCGSGVWSRAFGADVLMQG